MGLFDFLKPKKKPLDDMLDNLFSSIFPKGEKDVDAGTKELLDILNNKIDYKTARSIFLKSASLSRITEKFDKERLKSHLSGYCLEYFDENQVKKFHGYLVALATAMMVHRRTPSEVRREGDLYVW